MPGDPGPPGPPVEVVSTAGATRCHSCGTLLPSMQIPRPDSEPCTDDLQGVIRFDPVSKQLYFCDGSQWTVCALLWLHDN